MPREPEFDVTKAHRWFAVEANNAAWDLLEKPQRADGDAAAMVHLAHAAAWHWSKVGGAIQQCRAHVLLAAVHLSLGHKAEAVRSANRASHLLEESENATDFDRASVWRIYANVCRDVGNDAGVDRLEASLATVWDRLGVEEREVIQSFPT